MCGCVEDGIIPGFFGYEAGQSCVGDHFAWFVENCVPARLEREAAEQGTDLHALLERKAAALEPGESGLLALDWWNGNRSVLVDVDLSGVLLGATLATRPEEIYRALIEATAFGTRVIVETFQQNGVPIYELVACGGLPEKNRLLMQIFADVTGLPIRVSSSKQTPGPGLSDVRRRGSRCTLGWIRHDLRCGAANGSPEGRGLPAGSESATPLTVTCLQTTCGCTTISDAAGTMSSSG